MSPNQVNQPKIRRRSESSRRLPGDTLHMSNAKLVLNGVEQRRVTALKVLWRPERGAFLFDGKEFALKAAFRAGTGSADADNGVVVIPARRYS